MSEKDFCPFINGNCKSSCVFNADRLVAMGNSFSKCKLAVFVSNNDSLEDTISKCLAELIEK